MFGKEPQSFRFLRRIAYDFVSVEEIINFRLKYFVFNVEKQ